MPVSPSKRELIVRAIAEAVGLVEGVDGRVYRSEPEPHDREDTPFVTVQWLSEQPSPETVPELERNLLVEIAVYTRGSVPDRRADSVLVSSHALIMADTSLGGLAIDIRLEDAQNEIVSADLPAAKVVHIYSVKYRHSYGDMTI